MRKIFLLFLIFASAAKAEMNFLAESEKLIKNAPTPQRKLFSQYLLDRAKTSDSDGGSAITKDEFLLIKKSISDPAADFLMIPTKENLSAKAKHEEQINKIHSMNRVSWLEKAQACVALANYFSANASKKAYVEKVAGGLTPQSKFPVVVSLNLPPIGASPVSKEQDLINDCKFMQFSIQGSTLTNGTILDSGRMYCDKCTPLLKAAFFMKINQNLGSGLYSGNNLKQVMGMRVPTRYIPDKTFILNSQSKFSEGNAFVFGAYAGWKAFEKINGFTKEVPQILEIGSEGVSAIFTRFSDIQKFLYATSPKGIVKCGSDESVDLDVDYMYLGCFASKEVKTWKHFDEWKTRWYEE